MPKSPSLKPNHHAPLPPRLRRQWLAEVLNCDAGDLLATPNPELTPEQQTRFEGGLERLVAGEPLARVTGWQSFYGRRFSLNEATLDPRADSETLIDAALEHLPSGQNCRLLDLGTGSGCLLLTMLAERSNSVGLGVDFCPRALEAAAANAQQLGLSERTTFRRSNWFSDVEGRFDLILCNPPYVAHDERAVMDQATLRHDPHAALFAEDAGLRHYSTLFKHLREFLTPSGIAAFEHGYRQQDALVDLADTHGLTVVDTRLDMGSNPRCIVLK